MAKQDGFVVRHEWRSLLVQLSSAQLGGLLMALLDYSEGREVSGLEGGAGLVFNVVKVQLDADRAKRQQISEQNRKNIMKRWGASSVDDTTVYDRIPPNTTVYDRIENAQVPNKDNIYNIYNNTNIQDIKNVGSGKKGVEGGREGKKFIPPTLEEVQAYARERGSTVCSERFIDFYESKGWMIGKNKMKDWRAAFRTWERREEKAKPVTRDKSTVVY